MDKLRKRYQACYLSPLGVIQPASDNKASVEGMVRQLKRAYPEVEWFVGTCMATDWVRDAD
ncbi:Uncharacterised protein [Mycobacteroides abscessus subsp. abscessus]|nr:Uncharacterised protein [Mycobacteroides abscessus subsp. abscessus]